MVRRLVSIPALTLLLGVASFLVAVVSEHTARPVPPGQWGDLALDAVQLFTLEPPSNRPESGGWMIARALAALAIGLGLVEIVRRILPDLSFELRLARLEGALLFGRRHVVVAGLGSLGYELVQGLLDQRKRRVVAIERDETAWQIDAARARGALVIIGDAREERVLAEARATAASEVFCVSDLDSTNLEVVSQLSKLAQTKRHAPTCFASLSSQGMVEAVRRSPLGNAVRPLRLRAFDIHESRARALIVRSLIHHVPAPDGVAHYVVVGFGTLARTFAREAGKLAHFANRKRLRLTLVAPFSTEPYRSERERFLTLYPGFCPDPATFDLDTLADGDGDAWNNRTFRPADPGRRADGTNAIEYAVNAEFLDSGLAGLFGDVLEKLKHRLRRPGVTPCVIVCDDVARPNVENGMRLHHALESAGIRAPVYVYLAEEPGLTRVLDQAGGLHAFGPVLAQDLVEEIRLPRSERIARAYHEAYAEGQPSPAWDSLSHEMRRANEEAALHVDIKLHALQLERRSKSQRGQTVSEFDRSQLELLAEIEHNRWVAERLIAGWRYGARSDEQRTRPSIVPWADLPRQEGDKDFRQIEAILEALQRSGQAAYARSK